MSSAILSETDKDHPCHYLRDQGFADYTPEDHATWAALARRQRAVLRGRICDSFLEGLDALGISDEGIPDFRVMNARLRATTGWEVVAVPGLVPDITFFTLLAERKFPAGYWIRKPEQIDYIEEPDIFHDVFGHVPLIMQQVYADYLEAYGKAGLVAARQGTLHRLARLYWYTVEFGLARTEQGLRIVGAGIASSPSETVFSLESESPNRVGFDLGRVMRTNYRIDDFQETYFVLDSPDAWPALDLEELIPLWRELDRQGDLAPADLLESDMILHRGDGGYHAAKRDAA
ncbi:MAG: phenylalanine-4-hydroxylase PhhA [Saliniramus fredricksonii]|uniref:Phenylalanine-4-hydroxylase n=1 Tax=Saliniramus fredricksonii TaxID=1653334 RepID=A0A0P7ZXI8_9HYPH|nr:phenylalanine 4-monooxygenase [Saliniramus fredricksonii]KPQ09576.1 MAG: phenylalanine-4-hydroxylase PhhA [Saliniramus fredricksonii]SCC80417.1 Phenylalanine 4-hydroxylase [Saliniramus fredricksonii]